MTDRLPPQRGLLGRSEVDGVLDRVRVAPGAALAPAVHHYYSVEWDLATPFSGEALGHTNAQLAADLTVGVATGQVLGVRIARSSARLEGRGRRFGVAFRPAAFQPLLRAGASMSSLTNRVVPIASVFGREGDAWARAVLREQNVDAQVALTETFLARHVRPLADEVVRTRDVVERIATDRTLLRTVDVARALGVDVRTLQRWFRHYVGVGPKLVIRRYRLHEAVEQLRGPRPPALATLAASLGYADQAHFARDFKRVVGRTPRAFRG